MSFATVFNISDGEVFLILTLILILAGAQRLEDFIEGFRQGITQFRKAFRQMVDQIFGRIHDGQPDERSGHLVRTALTFGFGAVCVLLVVYELFK